ncbi:MAG: xanthine dehydrogenase family protein molybdopterin-binding subunit, partial [Rhizobiaceae bacterium]|nr:xanthine dehydrogenase family protein molybdopterin-binding subunit [Rhizobiaceae bacterium]
MNIATPKFGMGASVLRLEDRSFITGKGRYTDDIVAEGMLHGYVLRSPVAKASFRIGSTEAAKQAPGVELVLTGADVGDLKDLKTPYTQSQPDGSKPDVRGIPILCRDRVAHVGDAVAFVVAATRAQAQDAAELIEVEYDAEPAISDTANALDADTPLVWPALGTNKALYYEMGDRGATDAAFAKADKVVRIAFTNNRLVCNYMEVRSAIGDWDAEKSRLVLTAGSQGVHSQQAILSKVLGIAPDELRVVTPDVGGGFGPKSFVYREYALVLEAARRLRRAIKWTSDRTEHFVTDAHGRDNYVEAEMALDGDGRFLGLRIDLTANLGAYVSQYGAAVPWIGATMSTGVYDIPAVDVAITGVYTNTVPVDAYRGAGRPEAAFLLEKLVDACARELGIPREEIRRRNFIRPESFPYTTPLGRKYDVGQFDGHMTAAMERSGWADFGKRLDGSRANGLIRGIGMATYIEACAFPGSEPAFV